MKVFDEHDTNPKPKQTEPEVYTGSHDQFAPKPVKNPPLDTIAANPSNPNSSYSQRISSATSAIADKAAAVKDTIVSKLSSSTENKTDTGTTSPKTNTKSSFPTAFSHKVADTLSSTLGPVYEKVTSKMQGSGHEEASGSPGKGVTVKEFLVDTFKPGDDGKVLSEAITHAFHRGKGNQPMQETTSTTTNVVKEEGERRLQESGN
ncbi:low-temperature-induced 65 kDa protein-like [Bidens hawaiensis]|uniref:low-temperature-induced 65 kDa protein-like n=1 Tax=Bidens hawaiensis TaxID=980011 RepID=UPI00404A9C67